MYIIIRQLYITFMCTLMFLQERTRCLKTAKEQEKEVDALQDNLSQTRTELKAAGIKNGELKQSLDDITLQLKRRVSLTNDSIKTIIIGHCLFLLLIGSRASKD